MSYPPIRDVMAMYESLGHIERELVVALLRRLVMGQATYGQFRDEDPRDWLVETKEELLDGVVYMARALVAASKQCDEDRSDRAAALAALDEPSHAWPLAEGTDGKGGNGADE